MVEAGLDLVGVRGLLVARGLAAVEPVGDLGLLGLGPLGGLVGQLAAGPRGPPRRR